MTAYLVMVLGLSFVASITLITILDVAKERRKRVHLEKLKQIRQRAQAIANQLGVEDVRKHF